MLEIFSTGRLCGPDNLAVTQQQWQSTAWRKHRPLTMPNYYPDLVGSVPVATNEPMMQRQYFLLPAIWC